MVYGKGIEANEYMEEFICWLLNWMDEYKEKVIRWKTKSAQVDRISGQLEYTGLTK